MGTNYYLQCKDKETGRCFDMHIGKLSYGWVPNLRAYMPPDGTPQSYQSREELFIIQNFPDLKIDTWRKWKLFLMQQTAAGFRIYNEEDEYFSLRKFFTQVNNHMKYAKTKGWQTHALKFESTPEHPNWVDPEGFSFSNYAFA